MRRPIRSDGTERTEHFDMPEGKVAVCFASPEDTLLHKMIWYKLGNQISDRQWGDIMGVIKVQGEALDQEYLELWAPQLDVSDLLLRARKER